ncbi:autotransporter outer membrane beta-barrel domain-containing protein [Candidatus Tisiphia endosymbiont of Parasteatoda lunata]|uniref:autotransporter outer membrane beta-barrel domain-containing protein n=1 Tax=Candidatus Tisiphia endosymbiont of Parasteatoda lunata TaxID=3066275 RepID=UPI00313E48C6
MNNKSKKSSFLKNLLATASIASVIVGGSNTAFGAAVGGVEARTMRAVADHVLSTGAGLNQSAAPADLRFISGSSLAYDDHADACTVTADVAGGQTISTLDLNRAAANGAQGLFTVNTDTVINSIINSQGVAGGPNNVVPFAVGAGQSLTLGGRTAPNSLALAALGAEFVSGVNFAGGNGSLNIITGVGANFAIAPADLDFTKLTAANAQNATLNIDNAGNAAGVAFRTIFRKSEVAEYKIINISDGSVVEFNSTVTVGGIGNTLDLQQQGANSRINFGTNGDGTLLLTSNADAHSFRVMNGSLGGNNKDGDGIIHFNSTGNAGAVLSPAVAGNAVVGINKENRAKEFIVTAIAANAATITGKVYAKDIELRGGTINLQGEVDVGDQGKTNIKAVTAVVLSQNSNLGTTDFYNVANSTITVAAGKKLEGNFHANLNGGAAGAVGTITFKGDGVLKADVINKLVAIENIQPGLLELSGQHTVTELRGTVAGTHFKFAKDYKLTGNINNTAPAAAAASDLTFEGDAEITGNIGAAGAGAVRNIIIPKDSTVKVAGDTINAASIFDNAESGTLKLTNKAGDVTITSTMSANSGGTIDATEMKKDNTLNITGTIGTDPAGNDPKALKKLLLNGQKLNFDIVAAANKWVNIAGIDFGGGVSTVKMDVDAAKYAFGALTNAEEATFEVSENVDLYNTTTSKDGGVKEIKFTANDKTLTLHKGNDITANSITASGGSNLVFAGDVALKGDIGTSTRQFKGLKVNAGVKAITSGQGFFSENIELADGESTLVVDGNYTTKAVVGNVPGGGTLKFVNDAGVGTDIKFTTTAAANAGAINGISTLELHGGNVELVGDNGLKFSNIKFATAASLTLASNMRLDGINVDSTFDSASSKGARPTVILSAIDHTISKPNHIGDKDHLVNLQFAGDNTLNVTTTDFFAGATTTTDNQGAVNFKAGSDKVYGLGSSGLNLKAATFEVNTENFGDTYVSNAIINDKLKYTAGGKVAGGLQVGSVDGGSVAEFKDKVVLTAAITSKGADNKINFTDNATIIGTKLGTENDRFKAIIFNGNKKVSLKNAAMYAEVVNFGTERIVITDNNIISGTSHVNANINLNSGKLIFQDNKNDVNSTWGPKTSISTTLTADGKLGSIEVNTPIEVAASVPVNLIVVKDEAQLGADQEYKLISNGKNLILGNDARFGPLTVAKSTNQAYVKWTVSTKDDKDVYLLRSNDAATIAPLDVKDAGGDKIDQENAALFGREAPRYMTDVGTLDPKERGKALKGIVNAENSLVTDAVEHTNAGIASLVGARLAQVDEQQKPVGSGSDDVAGESMGAWAMPYYNQAVQKGEGSVVGYKTKSAGGILGFDALANENLMIGAAVSIVRTDMKYKDYKIGEKTNINTVMLSIYGSQQLDKNFFVQGLFSLGSNKIKNSDPRKVPTSRNASGQQIAKASYDSLSYGGQVLFGYNAKMSDTMSLIPMAGIRYTGSSDEGYKETGTDNVNKVVAKKTNNKVEAVLGTRFAVSVDTSGITVMPEAHAFVSQKLFGDSGKVSAKLDGMTSSFATRSDKEAKTLFNLGLGVTAKAGNMEYGAGYDAYLASKYVGHQGTLKVRVNF